MCTGRGVGVKTEEGAGPAPELRGHGREGILTWSSGALASARPSMVPGLDLSPSFPRHLSATAGHTGNGVLSFFGPLRQAAPTVHSDKWGFGLCTLPQPSVGSPSSGAHFPSEARRLEARRCQSWTPAQLWGPGHPQVSMVQAGAGPVPTQAGPSTKGPLLRRTKARTPHNAAGLRRAGFIRAANSVPAQLQQLDNAGTTAGRPHTACVAILRAAGSGSAVPRA